MKKNRRSKRNKRDSVRTPEYILQALQSEFGTELFDPCPYNPNFDEDKDTNGLLIPWGPVTFVNPPYSNVRPWLEKARDEHELGKTVILLLKVNSLATNYFPPCSQAVELRFFNHRVRFPDYNNVALFGSMLVVFRAKVTKSSEYKLVDYRKSAKVT